MRPVSTVTAVFLFAHLANGPAQAETYFDCGESNGRVFYPVQSLFPAEDAGWIEDEILDGAVALVSDANGVDVLIKDALGMISARSQGATVTLLRVQGDYATVLVDYPQGSVELYTFDASRGLVYWSQHRFGVMIDKAGTFVAACN